MAVRKRAATAVAAMFSLSFLDLAGLGLAGLGAAGLSAGLAIAEPLGLPPIPIPADNPQTAEKIALGDRLFHDLRFSSDGTVACATCHKDDRAFTDSPLRTSEGVGAKTGTRNAPTVIDAAYFTSFFWDGRSASLEDQSQHPFLNPVEMGLPTHEPILVIARSDPFYVELFKKVFGKSGDGVTMDEVKKAIAAYERTLVSGDSPFDRWRFGHEENAISEAAKRGFEVFVGQGRCVSCHVIEQDQALFTDNRFHNIGVGVNRMQSAIPRLSAEFLNAKSKGVDVDKAVLTDPMTSELGRFAVTDQFDVIGAFKTPTLRNVAVTAPYMHDGSLKTLKDVVEHYDNGGRSKGDPPQVNDYLSGGIRPLNLSKQQQDDLVAFLETLTSPAYVGAATK
ncbi:cytochrome-c peroxidase [Methylosinus sporium]|uniref:Methylamine utilization protein MauG n=1 Tax=Methylosinus sporium TaxID=428 RepID=A0A2U1SN97_METSR|nr:cytochrome c peroxidase [Methylosinus sporium]PWB93092.1 cytochrome-c peroxidase [Methylosinus sporium]